MSRLRPTPGERAQKERDQRRAVQDAAARKKAAKTEEKGPSHYEQSSGRGAHVRRSERHHGDD